MNRKSRRAAGSQGGIQAAVGMPAEQQFAKAVRLHHAGHLNEAAEAYRQILALDPNHANSLQNLGAIANKAGRYEIAVDLFRRALALNEASPKLHHNIAMALSALGQTDQAIVHCRRAIALNPGHIGPHMILGDAFQRQNRVSDALDCYARAAKLDANHATAHTMLGKMQLILGQLPQAEASLELAIALAPGNAAPHFYLGNLRSQQRQPQQAIDCYLRAIEIEPERLETHSNLCGALIAQSKYPEAIAHYQQILAYKPDYVAGHSQLAAAYLMSGDAHRALEAVRKSLTLAVSGHGASVFAACLRELTSVPDDDEMSELLALAISEPWDRPEFLMGHGFNAVRGDIDIAACMARAAAAWPKRLSADALFGATGLRAVSRHRVLRAVLENGLVSDVAMEKFLTDARCCLLDAAATSSVDDGPDVEVLGFYSALARQCFINEYVFALTDREQADVVALGSELISALRADAPFPVLWLLAYAAYTPLHGLAGYEALLDRPWPESVNALLTQQVREPLEELRLGATIPRLTDIEDEVSVLVRHQYEENPYPRWVKAPVPNVRLRFDDYLRQSFPFAPFRRLGKTGEIDMLTAGCGTGQQLLNKSQAITGARALAVDLSLTSLGYAKRKTEELGIRNIEFGQADILQLGTLGRRFDVIESSGVLHHLGDPEAGWRVLVSLLRPNGFMHIALYSELARREIVAAQKLVAERGTGRTADDIRRFRQELLGHSDTAMVRGVLNVLDFFSTSACRDLLFHAQEHRFTVPRIQAFLDANALQFVAFEVSRPVRRRYAERFPEDAAMNDLNRWQIFEREHPRTFLGMYQFWVQKADAEQSTA